ncbi:MAG: hypothetical protein CMA61_01240 [Euryarchaeota archaeon]|jgi:hypothetical protein|nr:hypothetical protein [Euryarchaeota archaeon]|tara:strand:- start:2788 stop:4320 length:1533 start_codon:yes stop_codon:yes gene_type:complete
MRNLAVLVALLFISPVFAGCFGEEKAPTQEPDGPFIFEEGDVSSTTWYHYPGTVSSPFAIDATNSEAVSAANITANLSGNSTPYFSTGTYYGTGYDTFEPTLGVTSSGAIFFTNYNGLGDGTHIIRSQDQGQTWEDVGPFGAIDDDSGQTPNSNDPYLYVDKFTDRLIKFDMHVLAAMFVEYSDNDGESWSVPFTVEGYYQPQDHQSIASMPAPPGVTAFHEVIYVYCINTGSSANGAQCSRSLDGGHTWDVQQIGYPIESYPQCSGLHGHVAGGSDGSVYRGNPSCEGPAVYRSLDGGYSWTEHTITTEVGMQQGWHSHEVAVAVDEEGAVHATWISTDEMPWYAYSRDQGATWSEPMMVAAPGVSETGFPTIFAGDSGRVVIGYIGEMNDCNEENNTTSGTACGWGGYMAVMTDAFAEHPLITSVAVNLASDPLDITSDCGNVRCGGFGDFIDVEIDDEGRPWIALAHNAGGFEEAIIGTFISGPALYGELRALPELPLGGNSTRLMG